MKDALLIVAAVVLALAACSPDSGPDALSERQHERGSQASCTAVCHAPGSTGASPDPLTTNGTGTAGKHIAHVTSAGLSCERCHFAYENNAAHMNGQLNVRGNGPSSVRFDSLNSATGTFTYVAGPPPAGNCMNVRCHTGSIVDWYGTASWTLPDCVTCHDAPLGARRQIFGTGGDFATNPSVTSHHVAGGTDPLTGQCAVCHDLFQHMGGTVRLREADAGTAIAYDPADPSTLEPFCLSCHDNDGAAGSLSPFADGATIGTMPYVASATISSSWNGSSTHRANGLTCAGTGAAGTGCHGSNGTINMHGSTNKGLLTNGMNFEIPLVSQAVYSADPLGSSYDYNNYRLCFDCHANYPAVSKEVVLGFYAGGVYDIFQSPSPFSVRQRSLFRDHYDPSQTLSFNDNMWGYPYLALHNYHLIGFESRAIIPPFGVNALQWKYRGDPSMVGRITCTACHNVHGTTVPTIRSTHEALGLEEFVYGGDIYTTLGTPIMSAEPMNCAVDCHVVAGQTSYWHTPGGE